jgi:hypothetical protein
LAVTAKITRTTIAINAGAFTQTAQAQRLRTLAVGLTAQATLTATIGKQSRAQAALTAQATIVVTGIVIKLDPNLTWLVPADTTTYVIPAVEAGDSTWIIDADTTTYTVPADTRTWIIESQQREYIL